MSTILNPGTTPVIYTDDARTIEPGTRISDVELDDTARAAIAHGYLVEEQDEDSADQPADQPAEQPADAPAHTEQPSASDSAPSGGEQAKQS